MAQFTLPTNWQDDYFSAIDFTDVCELYGKLREDYPGGGKSSMAQADPSRRQVARTVAEAHARGMAFNYLLNTTCIGNRELTRGGYRKIRQLLDWLATVGVDRITVALPFLAEMLRLHYPHFAIQVSTQAGVNSLEKVRHWEDLGAQTITLSHVDMNRDFREIRRITDNASCEVQLIVNMICKQRCPFVTMHGNFNAHASQSGTTMNRYNMDYYFVACLARSFSDPQSVLKSNWIRPEDLSLYEELGISRFKIAERGLTSTALAQILQAYRNRTHDGNFFDLVPTMSKYVFMEKRNLRGALKELFRVGFVNVLRLRKALTHFKALQDSPAYFRDLGLFIDNRKLDGVLRTMMKKDCLNRTCEGCDYCAKLLAECVEYPAGQEQYAKDLGHLQAILDGMVSGRFF